MCLGIPGEVVEFLTDQPDLARVDVSGVRRVINIGLLADDPPEPGEWVLIHVGFALSKIDEQEAAAAIRRLAASRNWPIQVETWDKLSPVYHKVVQLFTAILVFLRVAIILVVVFSITNTITMTVYERFREIGSIRAIGTSRGGVESLLALGLRTLARGADVHHRDAGLLRHGERARVERVRELLVVLGNHAGAAAVRAVELHQLDAEHIEFPPIPPSHHIQREAPAGDRVDCRALPGDQ